jgi:iron complex transport system substrate-binding protein
MPSIIPCRGTRRGATVLVVAALLISGCASGDRVAVGAGDEVTLAGAYGEVAVPVTDDGMVALDPTVATELLAIGVTPTHSAMYSYEGDAAYEARQQFLRDRGVELVEPDNLELIAQAQPTLIVGAQSPGSDELIDDLEKIAPVLVTGASTPWDESLQLLGQATGHHEQAQAVIRRIDAELSATKAAIEAAGLGGKTVSVMSACGAGAFCVYSGDRAAGTVLADLGFARPDTHGQNALGVEYGYTSISEEELGELVAPIIFVLSGSVQHGAPSPVTNPLFDVRNSTYGEVDFAAWYGASALDVPWILNDIRAVLLGDGTVIRDKAAAVAFFEQFVAAGS